MNLITEDEMKKIIRNGRSVTNNELRLPKNSILTPSAKSVMTDHKLKLILIDEKQPIEDTDKKVMENASDMAAKKIGKFILETGGYLEEKPEHMTQVYGNLLANKDNKLIKLRGEVDILMGEILKVQVRADQLKIKGLISDLQEVFNYIGELSRCEILKEPLKSDTILGFNESEIRDMSHHPKKYFGHEHLFNITYDIGEIPILLNSLRALIRKVEIACYEAFKLTDGTVKRSDLMQGYNRLSSVMYIITFKYLDS